MGPKRANHYLGRKLRDRARARYRNSLLLKNAINKNTTNEVGRGFTLLSTHTDTALAATLNGYGDSYPPVRPVGILVPGCYTWPSKRRMWVKCLPAPASSGQYSLRWVTSGIAGGDRCPFH